jgi:hypothetical protein
MTVIAPETHKGSQKMSKDKNVNYNVWLLLKAGCSTIPFVTVGNFQD